MTPFRHSLVAVRLPPLMAQAARDDGHLHHLLNCLRMVILAGGLWRATMDQSSGDR